MSPSTRILTILRVGDPTARRIILKHKPENLDRECLGREHLVEFNDENDIATLTHIHRMEVTRSTQP